MKEKYNFDYKVLHPFKWYILENFPFLEDSIDALTNYQLFCKLGEMYNKQVDAINTLGVQVETLTDWFDNLDVQEEINNKLDDMAKSGELEEIIASYLNTNALLCFDTINDMKSSENLVNGSYAKTLGYYEKNDGGSATYKIRTITNDDVVDEMTIIELNDNTLIGELIVENETINSIQVGCKINDNTYDNGVKLNTILNYCNTNHYNFNFLNGNYYVTTPIVINEKLFSIKITGLNYNKTGSVQSGAILNYNGEGYCLTLQKGGLCYTIDGITIECNDNSNGILCNGESNTTINFKNHLNNITIFHAIIGMKIVSSTYTFIDNYTFGGSVNTQVGLLIQGYEFTYINNSSIDGYSRPDSSSIGLKIDGGLNYYINNMDICNFGQGKAIYLTSANYHLYTLYFNNINIIRCDGGVVTECSTRAISSISFDNTLIALSGTSANSHYFYSIPNSQAITNFDIKNLTVRNLAQTNLPDYIYEQATGGIVGLTLDIKDLYLCPVAKSGIKGNIYDKYIYKNRTLRNSGMQYIPTNGTSYSYNLEIDFPKITNIPFITLYVVNHNDYKLLNPSYDDTTGKLKATINFTSAPASGNIRVGYNISEQGSNN